MTRSLAFAMIVAAIPFVALAGETVNYTVNGEAFEGYKAKADGQSKGLVLVIHDWDGLTEYEHKRADMLASMGYDAFAVDLYGKGNRSVKTGAKKAETGKLYRNRDRMRSLTWAASARHANPRWARQLSWAIASTAARRWNWRALGFPGR